MGSYKKRKRNLKLMWGPSEGVHKQEKNSVLCIDNEDNIPILKYVID